MPTTADYLNDLTAQKNSLAETLAENGVEVGESETFSTLVPKVKEELKESGRFKKVYDDLFVGRTNFSYLYQGITRETVEPIDTSNGTNFSYMFTSSGIREVPALDTSNGTNFSYMFNGCRSLSKIPSLNLSNGTNFQGMFGGCYAITEIPNMEIVGNGSSVNFHSMFSSLRGLITSGDIHFGTGAAVQCFVDAFYGNSNGAYKKTGKLYTGNITNMSQFLRATTVHIGVGLNEVEQIDLSSSTNNDSLFANRTALEKVTFVGTIQVSLSLANSPINVESAKSAINALVDYTGTNKAYTYTLSLSPTTLALLEEEGPTAPGDITWTEFAYNKGWNI